MIEKLLDELAEMREGIVEEFEEDSGEDFDVTDAWDDDVSFYAGLDRGIELVLGIVEELQKDE